MKTILNILMILMSVSLWAQDYAVFTTDTTRIGNLKKAPAYLTGQVWYINGKEMRYGSGEVRIKVNPRKLDTILYTSYNKKDFDTIICNVSKPGKYTFYYNHCCGAFNIKDEQTGKFIKAKVLFQLKNPTRKTYLGTLGETGMLLAYKQADTLKENCRSPMFPNIYYVRLQEIKICTDTTNCDNQLMCLQNPEKQEPEYDVYYRNISTKLKILYLPLTQEPLKIIYDPKRDKIEILKN